MGSAEGSGSGVGSGVGVGVGSGVASAGAVVSAAGAGVLAEAVSSFLVHAVKDTHRSAVKAKVSVFFMHGPLV